MLGIHTCRLSFRRRWGCCGIGCNVTDERIARKALTISAKKRLSPLSSDVKHDFYWMVTAFGFPIHPNLYKEGPKRRNATSATGFNISAHLQKQPSMQFLHEQVNRKSICWNVFIYPWNQSLRPCWDRAHYHHGQMGKRNEMQIHTCAWKWIKIPNWCNIPQHVWNFGHVCHSTRKKLPCPQATYIIYITGAAVLNDS